MEKVAFRNAQRACTSAHGVLRREPFRRRERSPCRPVGFRAERGLLTSHPRAAHVLRLLGIVSAARPRGGGISLVSRSVPSQSVRTPVPPQSWHGSKPVAGHSGSCGSQSVSSTTSRSLSAPANALSKIEIPMDVASSGSSLATAFPRASASTHSKPQSSPQRGRRLTKKADDDQTLDLGDVGSTGGVPEPCLVPCGVLGF